MELDDDTKAFIKCLVDRERRKQEMWQKVKENLYTAGVLSALAYFLHLLLDKVGIKL